MWYLKLFLWLWFLIILVESGLFELTCNNEFNCVNIALMCPNGVSCIINCYGSNNNNICNNLNIVCPRKQKCMLNCGKDRNTCRNVTINGYNSKEVIINTEASNPMNILCPNRGNCNINCNEINSCKNSVINATDSSKLSVIGNKNMALDNIQIYCPYRNFAFYINTKPCNIIHKNNTTSNNITLYAIQGIQDIHTNIANISILCKPQYDTLCRYNSTHCTNNIDSECLSYILETQYNREKDIIQQLAPLFIVIFWLVILAPIILWLVYLKQEGYCTRDSIDHYCYKRKTALEVFEDLVNEDKTAKLEPEPQHGYTSSIITFETVHKRGFN